MNAEVISIGDELTSGQRLDTNSQWLSLKLADLGIHTLYHTTVADDLAANIQVFKNAAARADVVIATGGLGPTADDLTRQAIAEATQTQLVLDEASLTHIQQLFAHRKREMPPANRVQAMFPQGSRVIPNPHGSAPGIDMDMKFGDRPSRVFALPGVPAEMREMWETYVAPSLEKMLGPQRRIIRHRVIRCFGVGESDLEQMLPDIIRRGRVPQVGITVSQATISLRITAVASSEEECASQIEPTVDTIHQCLGKLVFGEGEDELHHAVANLLTARRETLSVIEWGTTGILGAWLSTLDPQGKCFPCVANVRSLSSLQHAIGLEENVSDGISPAELSERLERSAAAARNRFHTTHTLLIGPAPPIARRGEQPGEVAIFLASAAGVVRHSFTYSGHPDILQQRTAKQALNVLRLAIS